jgi:hypothetical protein
MACARAMSRGQRTWRGVCVGGGWAVAGQDKVAVVVVLVVWRTTRAVCPLLGAWCESAGSIFRYTRRDMI